MAKEVTHAVELRDPIQSPFGPDDMLCVIACDDGSLYEFQRPGGAKFWNLRRRGERSADVRDWTQRRAQLPVNVKETLDDMFGKDMWTK